ncbi:MAG: hypothetical protein ACKPHU_36860, partial [Planctomycetaceae bacterium]
CTLPAGIAAGLALKARHGKPAADECLLLAISLFPLLVFALPKVPVYDGNRLFLICFPGLTLLAAAGWIRRVIRTMRGRQQNPGA